MSSAYVIKDVTKDLGKMLKLTGLFEPDSDDFWYDSGLEKRVVHKLDSNDAGKEIANYQDPQPKGDYHFFNPYAEGLGQKSPASNLFYSSIRIRLNATLGAVQMYLVANLLASKEAAAEKKEFNLSSGILRMTGVPVDKKLTLYDVVDEEMLKEFKTLWDRMDNTCVYTPYLNKQMVCYLQCKALDDPTWNEKFTKDIRKKSVNAFKASLMGILGITQAKELEQFSVKYDPDLKTSAKLYTMLMLYLKIYHRFNDVVAEANGVDGKPAHHYELDLGELQEVIERMPLAYAIAKHMVQPSLPRAGALDMESTDTTRLRIGNQEGRRRFGAQTIPDSSQGLLRIGQGSEPKRRFGAQVISPGPSDPFSPSFTPAGPTISSPGAFNAGYGSSPPVYGGGYSGGYGNDPYRDMHTQAPSNFMSPTQHSRF